ncbi:hypothetical protein HMPREF9582_00727 [Cutibacterium acnes HL060PA1]|nr:hypothetical protein HMPREF9619_02024 [Cutibacterium acnes HL082PA2]EFT54703.1 hypothetical protein HMPREF9610_02302 [Cutibacterium acnes HL027PA2]EFT66243.1 hypothetical protein HMPREF9582_00727 [Cutibacterium acnes HL060PA1]EGF70534.1 hypothetical protein HMPREF9588_01328 [Cutibacterium acnes HL025PA2]
MAIIPHSLTARSHRFNETRCVLVLSKYLANMGLIPIVSTMPR